MNEEINFCNCSQIKDNVINTNAKILQTGLVSILTANAYAEVSSIHLTQGEATFNILVNYRVIGIDSEGGLINYDVNVETSDSVLDKSIKENSFVYAELSVDELNYTLLSKEIELSSAIIVRCFKTDSDTVKSLELQKNTYINSTNQLITTEISRIHDTSMLNEVVEVDGELDSILSFMTHSFIDGYEINSNNSLNVFGKVYLELIYLRDSLPQSTIIPLEFVTEIQQNQSVFNQKFCLSSYVKNPKVKLEINEEGEKNVLFEALIVVNGKSYVETNAEITTDAFSTSNTVKLEYSNACSQIAVGRELKSFIESSQMTLEADQVFPPLNLYIKILESSNFDNYVEVGGVIYGDIIYSSQEQLKSIKLEIPFNEKIQTEYAKINNQSVACGVVTGTDYKYKQNTIYIDVNLLLAVEVFHNKCINILTQIDAVEELPVNENTFEVFIGKKGDDLFTVAKTMRDSGENILQSNPNVDFPLNEDTKLYVFRRVEM